MAVLLLLLHLLLLEAVLLLLQQGGALRVAATAGPRHLLWARVPLVVVLLNLLLLARLLRDGVPRVARLLGGRTLQLLLLLLHLEKHLLLRHLLLLASTRAARTACGLLLLLACLDLLHEQDLLLPRKLGLLRASLSCIRVALLPTAACPLGRRGQLLVRARVGKIPALVHLALVHAQLLGRVLLRQLAGAGRARGVRVLQEGLRGGLPLVEGLLRAAHGLVSAGGLLNGRLI